MKNYKQGISVLLLIASCQSATAAFVQGSNFVTDTDTGLDWLHLGETEGYSYSQVLTQTGAGGLFEGWSFASEQQLTDFFNHAGGSGNYKAAASTLLSDGSILRPEHGIMDDLYASWNVFPDSQGFAGFWWGTPMANSNAAGGAVIWGARMSDDSIRSGLFGLKTYDGFINLEGTLLNGLVQPVSIESAYPAYGSALVRQSITPVPVPAAIWLFLAGLIGLMTVARNIRREL